MEDKQLLEIILKKLEKMDERFEKLENKIDEIKEDTEITRDAVNSLIEWADHVSVITQVKFPVKKSD